MANPDGQQVADTGAPAASPSRPTIARKRLHVDRAAGLELVLVAWEDANLGFDDGPLSSMKGELVLNVTAGWFLRRRRRVTELVVESSPEDDSVRFPYTIPNSLIRRVIRTGVYADPKTWPKG